MPFTIRRIPSGAGQYLRRRAASLEQLVRRMGPHGIHREIFDGFVIQARNSPQGTTVDVVDPPAVLMGVNAWGPDKTLLGHGEWIPQCIIEGDRGVYARGAKPLPEPREPTADNLFLATLYGPDFSLLASENTSFRLGQLKTRGHFRVSADILVPAGTTLVGMGADLDYSLTTYLPATNSMMPLLAPDAVSTPKVAVVGAGQQIYYKLDNRPSGTPATIDMALSWWFDEAPIQAIAPGYHLLPRAANLMRGRANVAENPVCCRPDVDGRWNSDGIAALAGYTDEVFVVVPVCKQATMVDEHGDTNYDLYGTWGLYMAVARMNRPDFDPEDSDTWLHLAANHFFDVESLPVLPAIVNSDLDKVGTVGFPVHGNNVVRGLRVQRYAGGYAVLFQRTSTVIDAANPDVCVAAQALVVMRVDVSSGVTLTYTTQGYSEAQAPGHAPSGDDPDRYAWIMPLASTTVDEVAYFLSWRQWFTRVEGSAPSELPVAGEFLITRVDAAGVTLTEIAAAGSAWQAVARLCYAIFSDGSTTTRYWLKPNGFAEASYYFTTVTAGHESTGMPENMSGDAAAPQDLLGQIGKRKLCWLVTDSSAITAGAEPTFSVYLLTYDLDTGVATRRGKVFDSADGLDTTLGRIVVVTREVVDEDGVVTVPAVLLCSVVSCLARYDTAQVLISHDGGDTWSELAKDFAGRSGTLYAGNLIQTAEYGNGVSLQERV